MNVYDEDFLRGVVEDYQKNGIEFVDIRIEKITGNKILTLDGKTRSIESFYVSGACARAFINGAWGFSSVSIVSKKTLIDCIRNAVKIARVTRDRVKVNFSLNSSMRAEAGARLVVKTDDAPIEEKIDFAFEVDKTARTHDKRIVSTNVQYNDSCGSVLIANSFGSYVEMPKSYLMIRVEAYAEEGGTRQRGHETYAGVGGFELIEKCESLGRSSAEQAIRLLGAKQAPAGRFTCVFDPHLVGVFIHEAVAHACEADLVLAGASIIAGKTGEKIGSEFVTIIDDPTIKKTFGYFPYDSEGTSAVRTTLIENGVLKEFLHSLETSSRMGAAPNGRARATSYQHPPIIRVSNTYCEHGDWSFEEMIEGVQHGLYLKGSQYGYADPAKGEFVFKCDEAYLIKKGELSTMFRDVSLSGQTLVTLKSIVALGKNSHLIPSFCNKGIPPQLIQISSGGPHLKVNDIIIGGLTKLT